MNAINSFFSQFFYYLAHITSMTNFIKTQVTLCNKISNPICVSCSHAKSMGGGLNYSTTHSLCPKVPPTHFSVGAMPRVWEDWIAFVSRPPLFFRSLVTACLVTVFKNSICSLKQKIRKRHLIIKNYFLYYILKN